MVRFSMPHHPCDFELPDDWWTEAGMPDFARKTDAYRSTAGALLVLLSDIEPIARAPEKDWRGFERPRLIRILTRIATDSEIDPVPVDRLSSINDWSISPYKYRIRDGYHRYYGSIAAGFRYLPATVYG
jgi:hypothetical protein